MNNERKTRRRFLEDVALGGGLAALASCQLAARCAQGAEEQEQVLARLRAISRTHPRLHFDANGLADLRERAEKTHRRYADLLMEWVEKNRGWSPLVDVPDNKLTEVLLEESGAFVTNAALACALSGKAEHRELARRWTLAMCQVPRAPLKNYGLGIYAAGLARSYDWLHEIWTAAERARIRDHLARLVRELYLGSFPGTEHERWWADAHLHHDHWIPVGGFGEAALALLGEVEEADRWAARAKLDFHVCLSWLADDGAWHEGAADWCYALAPLLWFYGAWQSVTGQDLHDVAWIRNTAKYRLYHWLPDDSYIYLNDSFRSGRYNTSGSASCHLLRRLASLFRDGHAQWLAGRDEAFDLKQGPKGVYQAPYEGSSYHAERVEYPHTASQCMAWNVLWYDPSVEPKPPTELPRCRHFTNQGVAILRSGWDADASVVSLACGPLDGRRCAERMRAGEPRSASNFTHAHADYNALTLFARGHYFLIPPGYARRSSRFQNTVSVNGADLRVDPDLDVRLETVVEQADFAYAVGDATEAFQPKLAVKRYRRHLVLLDGCLVVYDDLQRADLAGRVWNWFQWTLHSDPRQHGLSIAGRRATWTSRSAREERLTLDVVEPQEFAWERATLTSRADVPMLDALRIVRPEWYSNRAQVLAVLTWEDDPVAPTPFHGARHFGVTWPERPERPAVAFAKAPTAEAKARSSVSRTAGGQAVLFFGHRPDEPGAHLRVEVDSEQR